jgi:hypothetical protein
MQQIDREHQMDDDDTTNRPQSDDAQTEQAPVIRLLANPRRVRRA